MTDDYTAAFAALGSATLGESGGRPMSPRIRPAWRGARVSAPAYPVTCSTTDNLAIHVAVAEAPAGSVLVVNVGHEPARGYWGEVLTTGAETRGIRGLVIDGGVRDVDALETHGFPVFSTMIALRGATKQEPGWVGAPSIVGDVEVTRGDWIVGDADGVTVVPAARLDDVLAAGRARAEKEMHYFDELRAGRTTLQLLSLDDAPIERG
ncbi:MAG TPA: dimethylmenaquinone methyltransferase [Acidimicrobiia bacterium]|nr:dimethylmenaquinone methyltransferase [Acidimicrobiia bacterium]